MTSDADMSVPVVDGVRVQPGDVILITAIGGDPIGGSVTAIDRSPYSHTVIVVECDGELAMASANQRTDSGYVSGVNLLRRDVFCGRRGLVLRPSESAAAAAASHATEWIEHPGMDGPADFAWFLLGISGLVGISRHLDPDGLLRPRLYRHTKAFVEAMYRWSGVEPCGSRTGATGPLPDPTDDRVRDKFYCATFVDHVFCAVGEELGFAESDPDPRDFSGVVDELRLIVEEVGRRIQRRICDDDFGDDDLGDDDLGVIEARFPDELFEDEFGPLEGWRDVAVLVRQALKLLFCAADKPELPSVEDMSDPVPSPGDPVYPPFLGLRHMYEAAAARRGLEIVNPTGDSIPFRQIDFGPASAP